MTELASVVERMLAEHDIKYQRVNDTLFAFNMTGDASSYRIFIEAKDSSDLLMFLAVISQKVPENQRDLISELFTRINYTFNMGCFEMDYSDGEIRFRQGVDFEGSSPQAVTVTNMLVLAVAVCDKYYPAIMRVLYANASPEEAFNEIQNKKEG